MRTVIWLVLIFAAAVIAATTLGTNDGLVTVYFAGWRTDVSLNLFVLAVVATSLALMSVVRGVDALLGLPRRASRWRAQRRDRAAQRLLREAQFEFGAGRYSRALKAAESALAAAEGPGALATEDPGSETDSAAARQTQIAARLWMAQALHRLQDLHRRDEVLARALADARHPRERSAAEAALLMGAEQALEDREPVRALQALLEMPAGVGRRTHALRLRLRAAQLAGQPQEALQTARLLAKHHALSGPAAEGLLRALCTQVLDQAHDIEQLRRAWAVLQPDEQLDPTVAVHAARRALSLGGEQDGAAWLEPVWKAMSSGPGTLAPTPQRDEVVFAMCEAVSGLGAVWLGGIEQAAQARGSDPVLALLAGLMFAQRGLWGKARRPLEFAAGSAALPPRWRRRAWRALAEVARGEADEPRAQRCERSAAQLD